MAELMRDSMAHFSSCFDDPHRYHFVVWTEQKIILYEYSSLSRTNGSETNTLMWTF